MPLSEVLVDVCVIVYLCFGRLRSGDTEKDIAEARKMIELKKRHNTFKLKIGARPLQQDVATM